MTEEQELVRQQISNIVETIPHKGINLWEDHEGERNLVRPGNFTKRREQEQGKAAHAGLVGHL